MEDLYLFIFFHQAKQDFLLVSIWNLYKERLQGRNSIQRTKLRRHSSQAKDLVPAYIIWGDGIIMKIDSFQCFWNIKCEQNFNIKVVDDTYRPTRRDCMTLNKEGNIRGKILNRKFKELEKEQSVEFGRCWRNWKSIKDSPIERREVSEKKNK